MSEHEPPNPDATEVVRDAINAIGGAAYVVNRITKIWARGMRNAGMGEAEIRSNLSAKMIRSVRGFQGYTVEIQSRLLATFARTIDEVLESLDRESST